MSTVAEPAVKATDIFSRILAVDLSITADTFKPVEQGEHIVGAVSEGLKKLYILREESHQKSHSLITAVSQKGLEHMLKHASKGLSREDCDCATFREELRLSLIESRSESLTAALLDDMFWSALRLELPELLDKDEVGIREGWQVVWVEKDPFDLPAELAGLKEGILAVMEDLATPFRNRRPFPSE